MKHRRIKSPVGKVVLFVLFVIVFALVAARLNKEKEMRARVEKRARELDAAAAVASAAAKQVRMTMWKKSPENLWAWSCRARPYSFLLKDKSYGRSLKTLE